MEEYLFVYRCRLCGKRYVKSSTIIEDWKLALVVNDMIEGTDAPLITPEPDMKVPHFCKSKGVGVADFLGALPKKALEADRMLEDAGFD